MNNLHIQDPFYPFITRYSRALDQGDVDLPKALDFFRDTVWSYYNAHKRDFAWRSTDNPYHIVVSEIMLQQTQTQRVVEKYAQFITEFPTFKALAGASTAAVIGAWVGLGYNRRALALQGIAQKVVTECGGTLSNDPDVLVAYKGLGPATASSIVTFAFNKPTVFIETNVRTVFLHAFFNGQQEVYDKQLLPFIAATVDQDNPREWYYALMDCGVLLKKLYKNPSRQSKHHSKQSKFEGSDRQLRGAIVRLLTYKVAATMSDLEALSDDSERIHKIVQGLCKDGFLVIKDFVFKLK